MTRPTRQRDHDRQRVRSEDADETETDAEGVEGADAGELDPKTSTRRSSLERPTGS